MMPKNRLKCFAVTMSCALLTPLALVGCVPVAPLIRAAVRDTRQPPSGGSSQTFIEENQDSSFLSSLAGRSDLRQTSLSLPTPDSDQIAQLKAAQKVAAQWAQQTLSGANKPISNGPGIVIGEPQLSSTRSAELDDFGAGCARWLQLTVGGQGAMGKTPLWGRVGDTSAELQKTDCRWTKADLPLVAQSTGTTHVALGNITGTSANCTLSYQLWDVGGNKAVAAKTVGAPLLIKGTREQIIAQLPKMAQILSARLLSSTRLSSSTSASNFAALSVAADDLQFLGSVPWKSSDQLLPEQEIRLRALSKKMPLAGVLWIYNSARDWNDNRLWRDVIGHLATRAPSNTLVLSTLLRRVSNGFAPHSSLLAQASARFPNNSALLAAQWSWLTNQNQAAAATRMALREVAASPGSTIGWIDLAGSYANEAQAIRRSKAFAQMTAEEQARVVTLYPKELLAGLKCTLVDPRSAVGWHKMSEGATFDGEMELADLALWKSISLDPDELDVYWWGLQIYQPKWSVDPVRLHQVAAALLRKPLLYSQSVDDVYHAFEKTDGSQGQVSAMTDTAIAALRAAIKVQPKQVAYYRALCKMLEKQKRFQEAAIEYSIWMKLQPDSIVPVTALADLYINSLKDSVSAEKMYLQAVAMEPQSVIAANNLGNFYGDNKQDYDRAEAAYKKAMELDPQSIAPVINLANLYWLTKADENTGAKYFAQAIRKTENDGRANAAYAWALLKHGKREQAIIEAKKASALGYTDNSLFKELSLRAE